MKKRQLEVRIFGYFPIKHYSIEELKHNFRIKKYGVIFRLTKRKSFVSNSTAYALYNEAQNIVDEFQRYV